MKFAADFRRIARDALFARWPMATLACFLASLIGASIANANRGVNIEVNEKSNISLGGLDIPLDRYINLNMVAIVMGVLMFVGAIALIWGIAIFIIGGAGKLGYAKFNLDLIDKKAAKANDIFSQFHRIGDGFVMNLLLAIYTLLWSMLFVIPGIIKTFSYAMTPYILYEHPEYTPNQAITESRRIMHGNKFRLFCLDLSFIGWSLLATLPAFFGIISLTFGFLGVFISFPLFIISWIAGFCVGAYIEAAHAAFYRDVSTAHEITIEV